MLFPGFGVGFFIQGDRIGGTRQLIIQLIGAGGMCIAAVMESGNRSLGESLEAGS